LGLRFPEPKSYIYIYICIYAYINRYEYIHTSIYILYIEDAAFALPQGVRLRFPKQQQVSEKKKGSGTKGVQVSGGKGAGFRFAEPKNTGPGQRIF